MSEFRLLILVLVVPAALAGQGSSEFDRILERLDRLEAQNRALTEEIRNLRRELAEARKPATPLPDTSSESTASQLAERVAVEESRTRELAQTKVEASQKLPISLTGMALFNAFWNTREAGAQQDPLTAGPSPGSGNAGATLRQTVLGLRFNGPQIFSGGKVSGTLYMDFFAGSDSSLNHLVRLRTGTIQADWKNTTVMFGQDKPLIAPRDPDSLAQVGISPLTRAGNLWLWQPQARVEQRIALGESSGLRAQMALYQTAESITAVDPVYGPSVAPARPGTEGRFEFWHSFGEERRIEFAPGFHVSNSHVDEYVVPSRIVSADWMVQPWRRFTFTGTLFRGDNVAVLGALRQGFVVRNDGVTAVRAWGGWYQFAWRPTSRLTFNTYGGEQDDRNSDLLQGNIARNQAFAANIIYHLGPNVLAALEASTVRTTYLGAGTRVTNHYDLAVAYLF